MQLGNTKPRRPISAALLNLFFPPLGHVYVGRLRRGVILWALGLIYVGVIVACTMYVPVRPMVFNALMLSTILYPLAMVTDATALAYRNRETPQKLYQRWWFYLAILAGVIVLNNVIAYSLRALVMEPFVVPTRPMVPTIQPGDRIFVDKLCVGTASLRRGDVVAFLSKGPSSPCWVMRVAGLPGDVVEVKNEHVFINGKEWSEPHAIIDASLPPVPELANYGPRKIPDDCFFVLGDNRRMAKDSRIIGPVPRANLYGMAKAIYWSRERLFLNPYDTEHYNFGRIRWERIGMRLDQ